MRDFLVNGLLFNGIDSDATLREKSRSAVLNSITIIGMMILLGYAIWDIIIGDYVIGIIAGVTAILLLLSFVLIKITRNINIGAAIVSYIAYFLFSFLIYTSGPERSGYFWMLLFPLVSIFFLGAVHGSITGFIFGITSYILLFHIDGYYMIPFNRPMAIRALGTYEAIYAFTIAFELIRRIAFKNLEETANSLSYRINQNRLIFENVNQGIFILDRELKLYKERSQFFDTLFKDAGEKIEFMELLKDKIPERDWVATKDYLELFFNKTVNPTLLGSINPIDKILMTLKGDSHEPKHTWLEFDFQRIVLKDGEIQILGIFRDVTERVLLEEQLENEEKESSKTMESLFQIIHVNPELMDEFIKDSEDEIEKINDLLKVESEDVKPVLKHIFTIVHTIKGNALLLGLNSLGNNLREFEDFVKELMEYNPAWQDLLKLTVNLAELKHEINGIKELILKIISFQKKAGDSALNRKYIIEESLKKSLGKLAKEYDKEIELDLSAYNNDIIPDKYRRLFKDSINQLIRNSVAHGIETRDERNDNFKDPVGKISISLEQKDENLEFIYRDDGRGLSVESIKRSAVEKRGFPKDKVESMTSSDAVKLIFHPGFSTTEKIDNVAGQGIGMNVVKQHVDSAGGKLNIKSAKGKFCEFKILLPV